MSRVTLEKRFGNEIDLLLLIKISNAKMEDELVNCSKCNTMVLQNDLKSHECRNKRQYTIVGNCPYCQKPYKRRKSLEDHENKCKKRLLKEYKDTSEKLRALQGKLYRIRIDPCLRKKVWETYIGQKTYSKCFCCYDKVITPFTNCSTFQAGHIISQANGGELTIDNLLPICRDCNMNMSAVNWDDYVAMHPLLPYRAFGANPPTKVIWATTIIQSFVRMWIERKNPNSHWRVRWRGKHQHDDPNPTCNEIVRGTARRKMMTIHDMDEGTAMQFVKARVLQDYKDWESWKQARKLQFEEDCKSFRKKQKEDMRILLRPI